MKTREPSAETGVRNDIREALVMPAVTPDRSPRYLRRKSAARYIREYWGLPCEPSWLAKLAVTGDGPAFRKCGRFPMYETADLDGWAQGRLSAPMRSTSEHRSSIRNCK